MNKKFLRMKLEGKQDLISIFEIWQGSRFVSKNNQGNYASFSSHASTFRPKSKTLRLHMRRIFFFFFSSLLETVVASMQRAFFHDYEELAHQKFS